MAVQPAIRIEGFDNLGRALRKIDAGLGSQLRKTSLDGAQIVARQAKHDAPRRTGKLANSIRPGASTKGAVVRAGSKSVPYANPIHWGWRRRNIAPNPFLSRAIDEKRREVVTTFERGLGRLLDQF